MTFSAQKPFVLYCKSYRTDVKRVARLARSITAHNIDKIPFYISAPQVDLELFREYLVGMDVQLLSDESIMELNPAIDPAQLEATPGYLSQQVVKSEFWRTGISTAYLCLDSDCIFIRSFYLKDFIAHDDTPYTVIDEARDLFYATIAQGKQKIIENYHRESLAVQTAFGRAGRDYNFGPNCPIWDRRVWQSLDDNYMRPRKLSFLDLIQQVPVEMRWYGEALLKYRAIDLYPAQPLFKMYHYAWQQKFDQRNGVREEQLKQLYCGVVYQSAWEREMDWPSEGGGLLSRVARRMRRSMGRM